MARLDPRQGKAIAGILRAHLETACELAATKTLLQIAARDKAIPTDWEDDLEKMKKTPEYRAGARQLEPILTRLEQGADQDEATELMIRMSRGPVN